MISKFVRYLKTQSISSSDTLGNSFISIIWISFIFIDCIFQLLQAPERQIDEAFKPHVSDPIPQLWQSWWEIKGFTIPISETFLVCVYLLPWLWRETHRNTNFRSIKKSHRAWSLSNRNGGRADRKWEKGRDGKRGGRNNWLVCKINNKLCYLKF